MLVYETLRTPRLKKISAQAGSLSPQNSSTAARARNTGGIFLREESDSSEPHKLASGGATPSPATNFRQPCQQAKATLLQLNTRSAKRRGQKAGRRDGYPVRLSISSGDALTVGQPSTASPDAARLNESGAIPCDRPAEQGSQSPARSNRASAANSPTA